MRYVQSAHTKSAFYAWVYKHKQGLPSEIKKMECGLSKI